MKCETHPERNKLEQQIYDAIMTAHRLGVNTKMVETRDKHDWAAPAKPIGGNSLTHRIFGSFLVLFNKADFIRWW